MVWVSRSLSPASTARASSSPAPRSSTSPLWATRPFHARATAGELYSPLHQSYAPITQSISDYISSHTTTVSYLKTDLPEQLELITAQVFTGGKVLIRIAHSYGVGESAMYSTPVTIDLSTLFLLPITSFQEMTVSGALPKGSRTPYSWNTTGEEAEPVTLRLKKAAPAAANITIKPAEVRTFIVTVSSA